MEMALADKQEWVNWLVYTPYEGPNLAKSGLEVGGPLSSSYNIPGIVPVCWLHFQCFLLKPAKLKKFDNFDPVCPLF